jgi:hypothetical protein
VLFAREGADVRSLTAMNIRTRSREERVIEKEAMILKEGNSQEDDASAMSDQRAGPAADIPVDAGETDAVVGPSKPHLLQTLGPGLITGVSDDDPSGIGTYSQAGAQLGYGIAWTMLFTYPLMAAIQELSARVGRVTGHGLAGNLQTLPGLATANHRFCAFYRQCGQYRRRSRRDVRRHQIAHRRPGRGVCPSLRRHLRYSADFRAVCPLRARIKVAQP